MFSKLLSKPVFIMRFAIYLLFLVFACYFYFSDIMNTPEDKTLKNMYCGILFLYGCFRLIRTWQQFREAIRTEEDNNED